MSKMNSINETTRLCKERNIGVTRNMLRKWALDGVIPSVRIGRRVLINWDALMAYLDTNTLHREEPQVQSGVIRRISA